MQVRVLSEVQKDIFMNRSEHLKWCKDRAIQLLNEGDIIGAYTSFLSDMKNHEETEDHIALDLGMMLMISGNLNTDREMRDFIEGFN